MTPVAVKRKKKKNGQSCVCVVLGRYVDSRTIGRWRDDDDARAACISFCSSHWWNLNSVAFFCFARISFVILYEERPTRLVLGAVVITGPPQQTHSRDSTRKKDARGSSLDCTFGHLLRGWRCICCQLMGRLTGPSLSFLFFFFSLYHFLSFTIRHIWIGQKGPHLWLFKCYSFPLFLYCAWNK